MVELTKNKIWKMLSLHAQKNSDRFSLQTLAQSHKNTTAHRLITPAITLDYSEQCIDDKALTLLLDLAQDLKLKDKIQRLMSGYPVNYSQHVPALHTAVRCNPDETILVKGKNIVPEVIAVRKKMYEIAQQIRDQHWLGYSGKPIKHVVNVGIGGSMLGAQLCLHVFADLITEKLEFHFLSDFDPLSFDRLTHKLDPETTLFIIASKSFTTPETLYNYDKARLWLNQPQALSKHFIAVTAYPEKAKALGLKTVLPIWNWVGGRYSLCSAINLMTCIAIGEQHFSQLLAGAKNMDEHFLYQDFEHNMPVLLGLLGIWNDDFLSIHNLLILIYSQDLEYLLPYLQQLDMESNGKSKDLDGHVVDYATGPIVWGGLGDMAQHSYYQLLCQGTHRTAADLISIALFDGEKINNLCYAHKSILNKTAITEDERTIPVKTPMNHLSLADTSPLTLGALIALYEHKIYTQSVIWNINPFDQPGVDTSKIIIGQ